MSVKIMNTIEFCNSVCVYNKFQVILAPKILFDMSFEYNTSTGRACYVLLHHVY